MREIVEEVAVESSLTGAFKGLKDLKGTQDIQETQDPLLTPKGSAAPASAAAVLQLPLNQFIRQAVELQREQSEAYDPRADKFQTPLFTFARFCKAHPTIAALSEDEAMQQVDVALYELAMCEPDYPANGDPWEYFFPEAYPDEGIDGDQARMDFAEAWAAVLTSPFDDPLSNALRLAEQRPFQPPRDRGLRYQKFVSIAAWLQAMMGDDGIILLPTHKLAPMLSCTPRNVTSLRRQAIRDGLLQEIRPHHFSSTPGESEATAFRFVGTWKEGQS